MSDIVDTKLSKLFIHDLTEEEFEQLTPEEKQLYLTPDTTAQDIAGAIYDHNNNANAHQDIRNALKTYIHDQAVASMVWTIHHNLNRWPSITVVDSSGSVQDSAEKYINENTIELYFNSAFTGKAYLN